MSEPSRPISTEKLTPEESAVVSMVRVNKAVGRVEIRKQWTFRGWKFVYNRRDKRNLWGRFGGGWNWKLGFQAGGSTVILSLLVCELTISRSKS